MDLAKFKDNKKQMFALGAVVVIGVLVGGWQFGLKPVLNQKDANLARVATLDEEGRKIKAAIDGIPALEARYKEAMDKLRAASGVRIPVPVLGNYAGVIEDWVMRYAETAKVKLDSVKGVDPREIPQKPGVMGKRTFGLYTAEIRLKCSYAALKRFVRTMETDNPYVSIVGLAIDSQADDTFRHAVVMNVAWPMWLDVGEAPSALSVEASSVGSTKQEATTP